MVARVTTVAFIGMEAKLVDVQVHITPGLAAFNIVGLPDKAVGKSRERVRSALYASGLSLPAKRITVNLAPADLPKEGSHYDLPIALGLMAAMGAIPEDAINNHVVVGEFALDGSITSVAGVPAVSANDMLLPAPREGSAEVAKRVQLAREMQATRYQASGLKNVTLNAHAPQHVLEEVCALDAEANQLLYEAAEKMRLSARGLTRVMRVARTLADLANEKTVARPHLAEALSYRMMHDRRAIAA